MRGVKMCGLNNWKDELPYTEVEGGEVLPWCLGDDQRSVSGMLSLSCSSCIPGRAVEPAAGPARLGPTRHARCRLRTRFCVSLSDGWLLGVAKEKALQCVPAGLGLAPAIPQERGSCVLGLPVTARTGRGWGWLGAPGPGTEMGTEAHVTCLEERQS